MSAGLQPVGSGKRYADKRYLGRDLIDRRRGLKKSVDMSRKK